MVDETGRKSVREVIGVFFDVQHLEAAIRDLRASGFEHDQLGLLASEIAVEKSLADFYTRTNNHHDVSHAPVIAFVKKNSVGDTFRALEGGLFFVGGTVAMGAAVATGAIFGGALVAAAAGAAGVVAIGALVGGIIHQSDAEYLEEQVDEGFRSHSWTDIWCSMRRGNKCVLARAVTWSYPCRRVTTSAVSQVR